ncbi:N-acetylmuramoyl-L-alanine amidase [Streptomyces sp. NPDC127092]|uniref:N-acetylmuramoyl-L-alanine amidase n=1 Tax=Streptomyces sp. NPDC127092 TaxID=3347135 RepID=UPI0036513B6C
MKSGRRARRTTGRRVRRTALGAALAAAAVLGIQSVAGAGVGTPVDADGNATRAQNAATKGEGPVKSEVQKLPLTDRGHGEATLTKTTTEPFDLMGVSWTDPAAKIKGTIQVRARSAADGTWGEWRNLEPYPAFLDGKRAGARGSTEPVWVGSADGVEVRVSDGTANNELPDGLRVDLVDPKRESTGGANDGGFNAEPAAFSADLPPTTPGPASTAPQPKIVTRAEWGADESLNNEGPVYLPGGKIKAAFVHHTPDITYDCADSDAVVRSLHVYHVKTNGWRDLGYNFLVDKCGKIFEGRQGGIDQPVLGAHTYGWNSESTSVAILGDHTAASSPASDAALASASKVIAYKLGQYGVNPAGKATLTAGATQSNYFRQSFTQGQTYEFDAVSGHRNGFNTQCPGDGLYPQLSTVRSYATGSVSGLGISSVGGGATRAGTGYETPGPVSVTWTTSTPNTFIHKFEVLVDGQTAVTTGGATRSWSTVLGSYGAHTITVRATHTSGKVTSTPQITVTVPGPKTFQPVTPTRLMDTRAGLGVPKAKVGAGQEVVLQVTGANGIPATGVGAVVLNVTATNPTDASFVSVYPNGTDRTSASNLNFTAGTTIPNLVTVPVVDGKVRFYNRNGSVDLIADITGYYVKDASGSTHSNLGPLRMMDTRAGLGVPQAKVGPGAVVDLQVTGAQGVPATGVTAVVLNVTATAPTAASFVSVYPAGTTRTSASNLNFVAGQTIPNLVIVPVGADGKVSFYNRAGSVDLIADITGYFSTDPAGASHVNLGPLRMMDTRAGLGVPKAKVGPGGVVSLQVAGAQGVPATGVKAVVLNVTATAPTAGSFVSVYPSGETRTSASNLNFVAGQTIPNLVIVPVGADGKVNFYNKSGSVDLIADITGYFIK